MPTPTLLYHDVVSGDDWSESGFPGAGAAVYKMRRDEFAEHVERLRALDAAPGLVRGTVEEHPWRLTFDDGGVSSLTLIAPILDRVGWKGHFFVTTGWIGRPGFLDARQIRELADQGHVIGSHSVSHPLAMASCSFEQLRREWRESEDALGDILGRRPGVGSIPGGAFSPEVARAAAEAGIRCLFTSEPTARTWTCHGVVCIGRYTLWRGMSPSIALDCARGQGFWPVRQRITWQTKKLAKRALGVTYLRVREQILGASDRPARGAAGEALTPARDW